MKECDIESIVALGMAGSEIGLLDIPHIFLPAEMHYVFLQVNIQDCQNSQIKTMLSICEL